MTRLSAFPAQSKAAEIVHQSDTHGGQWRGLSQRTLRFALAVLPLLAMINVGVLVWSLGSIEFSNRIVAPGLMLLAGLVVFVPMIANLLRLAIWSRFLGLDLGVSGSFRVITGTMIANSLTPPAITGMPIRFVFLMNEGVDAQRAASLLTFQTAEDILILFTLVGICLGLSGFALSDFFMAQPQLVSGMSRYMQAEGWIVMVAIIALVALALVLGGRIAGPTWRARIHRVRRKLRVSWASIGRNWRSLAREGKGLALITLGLTTLQWVSRFSIAGLIIAAFGLEWRPALYWLLQYLVQAISSLVPTPGGAGGAEGGFLLLFSLFIDVDVLVPAMSAWRLMYFYLPLGAAAVAFFCLRRSLRRPRTESPDDSALSRQVPAE